MNDVAKKANVSPTTVSHVINGTRYVHPDTKKAVHEAIATLGYVPNSLARALAGGAQQTIGVAISALNNHHFQETLHLINEIGYQHGMMTIYSDHQNDPEYELKVVTYLHQRRVDGILMVSSDNSSDSLAYLKQHRIPTVLIDRFTGEAGFDQVGTENAVATESMVTHLLENGHKDIAFLKGIEVLSTTTERFEGFVNAFKKQGIEINQSLIMTANSETDTAKQATLRLLRQTPRPTAIFSSNNAMTIGVLQALRQENIRIPDEIAVAGFDDFDWAELFTPPLSLIAQPIQEIAETAVKLLLRRIKEPQADYQICRLAPQLMLRESCRLATHA